jgi:hypothetical protein
VTEERRSMTKVEDIGTWRRAEEKDLESSVQHDPGYREEVVRANLTIENHLAWEPFINRWMNVICVLIFAAYMAHSALGHTKAGPKQY